MDAKRPANAAGEESVRAVLSIHPVLRVRNRLPVPAALDAVAAPAGGGGEWSAGAAAAAAAGGCLCVYGTDGRGAVGLAVGLPGFRGVRRPAAIALPDGGRPASVVELEDEDGLRLTLGLEYEVGGRGGHVG